MSNLDEVTTILHNHRVWLTSDGRLEVYDIKLANRLNRHFKKFEKGKYLFQPGEECFFQVPPDQIGSILSAFLVRKST